MMREREEVSKEEEKITVKRSEGRELKTVERGAKCARSGCGAGTHEGNRGKCGEEEEEEEDSRLVHKDVG